MSAEVLADDGIFKLRFVRRKYVAGCHAFTREEAIKHWGTRATTGLCGCHAGCTAEVDARTLKRARLFLKAIEEHNPAQPSPQQAYRDLVEGTATEPGAEV